ncbi:Protein r.t1.c1 [Penicillium chermesinum]|uniref:Protein ROT1 n=1 Tax=Penicillium chermesinum TaxID=63820 RepID=A0A9W9TD08_9EURO|nr:Protein r.t1.c1 [Penicillium chermesinum]KAJ5217085.1 Protein r.t1.c1 [Penicillium chermesinum]KAJ6171299.1 Protein r.t1.c1 [Penicillium chermesinum]
MVWIWSLFVSVVAATSAQDLVGTWTSKSKMVLTGPTFYDPLEDKFIEPILPGISYSFDANGYYEEAFYRALANPSDPSCPSGIMQWQHGSYVVFPNGSLSLHPIAVDGRQMLSEPCRGDTSHYTRYNNTEHFKGYSVSIDKYHGVRRLDLTMATGEIQMPLYFAYKDPKMLPTNTLNPVPTGHKKREIVGPVQLAIREELLNPDRWWWLGVFMTSLGGMAFFFSS